MEKEAEELSKCEEVDSDRLQDVYERLEDMDAATAEPKASRILYGLGRYYMYWPSNGDWDGLSS